MKNIKTKRYPAFERVGRTVVKFWDAPAKIRTRFKGHFKLFQKGNDR